MEKKIKKSTILKYVITMLVLTGIFFAVLGARDFFNMTDKKEVMRTVCDAFTVPAVVGLCAGALVWISGTGCFDGLAFIGRSILGAFIPGLKLTQKRYKEYKEDKEENRKKISPLFLFLCSLVFLVGTITTLILYYNV